MNPWTDALAILVLAATLCAAYVIIRAWDDRRLERRARENFTVQVSYAPRPKPKSCATCAWSDTALRDDEVVMECHFSPPMTMPPAPPLPEATVSVDDGPETELELLAFAEPHRYPVVTETDWCSTHQPKRTP